MGLVPWAATCSARRARRRGGTCVRVDAPGDIQEQRPRPGVDDLVGGQRPAQHEAPAGRRGRECRRERPVVERDHAERVAGCQEAAERGRDHVDQRPRSRRVDGGRSGICRRWGSGRRRGAVQRRSHGLDEPRGSLVDLGRRVPPDDDPVVLHDGDRRRRQAGPLGVRPPSFDDGPGERKAGVGVGHPHRAISEQPLGEGAAVAAAGDRVDVDGVRVDHEALGQEGVEQQLHGGPAPAGVGQAGRHGRAHDRVPPAVGTLVGRAVVGRRIVGRRVVGRRGAGVEERQQRLHVERHEIVRGERCESHATRLDVQDAVDLGRGVAAAPPAELGVTAEAPGDLDQLFERRDRRRRQLPSADLPAAHRAPARDAAPISSAPCSANQRMRASPSGKPGLSRPWPST